MSCVHVHLCLFMPDARVAMVAMVAGGARVARGARVACIRVWLGGGGGRRKSGIDDGNLSDLFSFVLLILTVLA